MLNKILWFTGLSGSGKTTLAKLLIKSLKKKYSCYHIDGDPFRRKNKNKINKLNKKNIVKNNLDIINLCKKKVIKFDFIVVSAISPLYVTKKKAKEYFGSNYIEFLVEADIPDLIKRDTKLLYKRAINENYEVLGFNSKIKYEKSKHKKIYLNTSKMNKKACLKKIKETLKLVN